MQSVIEVLDEVQYCTETDECFGCRRPRGSPCMEPCSFRIVRERHAPTPATPDIGVWSHMAEVDEFRIGRMMEIAWDEIADPPAPYVLTTDSTRPVWILKPKNTPRDATPVPPELPHLRDEDAANWEETGDIREPVDSDDGYVTAEGRRACPVNTHPLGLLVTDHRVFGKARRILRRREPEATDAIPELTHEQIEAIPLSLMVEAFIRVHPRAFAEALCNRASAEAK